MQLADGQEIHIGDTVWFTQDGMGKRKPEGPMVRDSALNSGRVVLLEERDVGLVVDTQHGRELIGLYAIQFVQPE